MTFEDALGRLCGHYGILSHFYDLSGNQCPTSLGTQMALLKANGVDAENPEAVSAELARLDWITGVNPLPQELIVTSGQGSSHHFGRSAFWHVINTDTGERVAEGDAQDMLHLPALASGVYDLVMSIDNQNYPTLLIAAPERAPSIDDKCGRDRIWGATAALYGLQSEGTIGLGNFTDLAALATVFGDKGADFLGVNPVHALGTEDYGVISPYSPSHRGALSTLHIAFETGDKTGGDDGMIDYMAVKTAQAKAFHTAYIAFLDRGDTAETDAFETFFKDNAADLLDFAVFEALSEIHGPNWLVWPSAYQDVTSPQVAEFRVKGASRIRYHMWLQWRADVQLGNAAAAAADAGMGLGLYLDLAVGSRRSGAESWCEQASVAQGVGVGAPPDHLSPEGQDWGLTALSPVKNREQKYAALRRILRNTMRHAGVVRIDHVLGLRRSYWIPDDGSAGGYIEQSEAALCAIIKIEAERAGTVVIGEDLGLVPDGFRDVMRGHGFYGYSVLQYEKHDDGSFRSPDDYHPQVLACFASHDTPTLRGYETGSDIQWWNKLGWISDDESSEAIIGRNSDVTRLAALQNEGDEGADLLLSVHQALANGPAALVTVQLDDILGNIEAQNIPGTIDQHPNWRRRYDVTVENIASHAGLQTIAACMETKGRSNRAQ